MPGFLRQSTASQSRALGPFLDDTDFKSPETGLTIANTDIKLVVNGAASANKNSGGGTHRVNGVYGVTFDATDTATVGEMEVSVVVSGALPVFDKFFVVEEAVYDAFYAASAPGYVVDPNTALIKAKTDNLPSDPADQSALQTLIEDVPTVAEFNARTLPTASYATAAAQTTLQTSVDDVPTNAELATSQAAADDATLAAIAILQTSVDNVPTNAELATALDAVPTAIENADALLDRNMATGTDSGSTTVRTPRQALRFLRNKWSISGTTLAVTKEDDSTSSWTAELTTNPSADPITAADPSGP